jgi:hypothetical protein
VYLERGVLLHGASVVRRDVALERVDCKKGVAPVPTYALVAHPEQLLVSVEGERAHAEPVAPVCQDALRLHVLGLHAHQFGDVGGRRRHRKLKHRRDHITSKSQTTHSALVEKHARVKIKRLIKNNWFANVCATY